VRVGTTDFLTIPTGIEGVRRLIDTSCSVSMSSQAQSSRGKLRLSNTNHNHVSGEIDGRYVLAVTASSIVST
jgi:hypothetical protein